MGLFQRIPLVLAAMAALALSPRPAARALTVDAAPLPVLMAEAALGLRGVVASVTAEPVPGHPRRVRSRVVVLIDAALWARDDAAAAQAAQGTVELLLPGGSLAGYTTYVPGVPRLAPGDAGLFLLEAVGGEWMPLGYALGVLLDAPSQAPAHDQVAP